MPNIIIAGGPGGAYPAIVRPLMKFAVSLTQLYSVPLTVGKLRKEWKTDVAVGTYKGRPRFRPMSLI